ncbi:DarT ssDNA thymidine ADP-ribosyltransferase family protein [Vibrio cyclitrophicus 1F53]|uniref:DarT ssDNA thymidine ADP-ribosyltransferase family protein n=1 Tax=Vibrio cyclitrophicus TaxID=47951 RepID=UPI000308F445|nr:DarT ssDNA thymidine ADP-ribosyltransferase family protein [Vibrio cyclitrophicus]OEF34822.1 hypothetical protein OA7_10760 [Vibrio cyclitrophicus 1F53]OEF63215.1 hypothetical protein OAA_15215 [Vibrio cyclitrophicus 1F175]PMH30352.1 hypothetical protein BCU72_01690 [Vibrio cyclitrophicus]PMH76595.1 hypothetical protein BCU60_20935 [Vibrio cyclitrophicus]
MPVPTSLKHRYAYHFTLIDNLESILDHGILCMNLKDSLGVAHENVAEERIQSRRFTMSVPCSDGKVVHDFVPFYFSKKTPMQLGIINKKNVDQPLLIYFAVQVETIENTLEAVFSDASANTEIPPNFYSSSNANKLETLNWEAIDDKKWGCPTDTYRHQKMAELLLPNKVEISQVSYIVVWNEWIKTEVEKIFAAKGVNPPTIRFDTEHYYVNFYDNESKSIVTGPRILKHCFDETIKGISDNILPTTKFENIEVALSAVKHSFTAIKELADIDGLKASYGPHSDDVGTHSKKVAGALQNYPEYLSLTEKDKSIVTLSSFLHDIGKGPKSRWPLEEMTRADNDHAVKSLPMLKRILTEDIGNLDHESIRKIVMLVTYDDLIGDIVAKGRSEKELFNVITSENDLNMLVALGKSDMVSINFMWPITHHQAIESLKEKAINSLRASVEC